MTVTVTVTGSEPVVFAHEAERRQRVAVLGTSGHAFRNYLPVLPFVPVEYVAQWDPDLARAKAFARQFGAGEAGYDDVAALLRAHAPEAVWIATDEVEADGRTVQPRLIAQCLAAGCHVFCDKPVASTAAEVRELIRLRDGAGRTVAVGAKTMHYPTYSRVRALLDDPAAGFGALVSLTARYPLTVPPGAGCPTPTGRAGPAWATSGTPPGRPCASAGRCAGCTSSPTPAGATPWSRGTSAAGRWWASTSRAPSPASAPWSTWRRSARGPTPWWRTPPG